MVLTVVGLCALAPAGSGSAQDGSARVVLFVSSDCPHCQHVQRDVMPRLRERFGSALQLRSLDVADPAHYESLMAIEDAHQVAFADRVVPVAVIGERLIAGADAIERELGPAVERAIAEGGAAWPDGLAPPTTVATTRPAPDEGEPIWIAYFYQTGCRECARAHADLDYVRARHPRLRVEEHNVIDELPLASWLASRAGREMTTPAVFVGNDALIGASEVEARAIERLVARYEAEGGAPREWAHFDANEAMDSVLSRFRSMGPLAVVGAGLVDGINPCAFATLIFFVSYLSLGGRRGREVLFAGIAFTIGVFLAYLAVGLGLYRVLDSFGEALPTAGRWVMMGTAAICALLAVLSFRDFLRARRGELKDMALMLPEALRARIHSVIRRGKGSGFTVPVAFGTGLVVSLLELACTGQVYLPTILFVTTVPELRGAAIAYLLLYNVLFVLPLVVVFVLVYYGTTSKQLTGWLTRRAKTVKLAMSLFFGLLAAWLVVASFPSGGAAQLEPGPANGTLAPPIDVEWVVGEGPAALGDTRGRVTVVLFFSAMCPACRDAIGVVDDQARVHGDRLAIVAISEDVPRMLRGLFGERPVSFPVARDRGGTFERWGVTHVPTMCVIDRSGRLRARLVGSDGTRRLPDVLADALRP